MNNFSETIADAFEISLIKASFFNSTKKHFNSILENDLKDNDFADLWNDPIETLCTYINAGVIDEFQRHMTEQELRFCIHVIMNDTQLNDDTSTEYDLDDEKEVRTLIKDCISCIKKGKISCEI